MENGAQESSKIARVILDGATRLIKISAYIPRYVFEMVHILQAVQNGPREGQVKMRKMMDTMTNNRNEQNEAFAGRKQNNMDMRNPSYKEDKTTEQDQESFR